MQTAATRIEMRRRYAAVWLDFWGAVTSIEQIVCEDFPEPEKTEDVTRYQLDMLKDLTSRLTALIEGYERR